MITTQEFTETTVNCVLERTRPGNTRKANLAQLTTGDTDKKLLRLSKKIFDGAEYKAIHTLDGDVREWMWNHCVPNPLYRQGVYLVPVGLVTTVEAYLREQQALRATLVEAFLAVYPHAVEAAAARLGAFYNPVDYPTVDAMRGKFSMTWRYVAESAPSQIQAISSELFEEEREKAEAMFTEAIDEVRQYLRTSLAEIVDHMADRLTDAPTGKRKVFRNTLCDNLTEFCETFTLRNVTQDADLAAIVDQLKQLTAGVTPSDLRDNDGLRTHLAARLSEVKATMNEMVVTAADRAISLA